MAVQAADLIRWMREQIAAAKDSRPRFGSYRDDPAGYCRVVLGVRLTPAQEEIASLLTQPPYKVLVKAGHNVGKSFLAACLVNWWHDAFRPGVVLTTAPTDRQVKDILWKEVRTLRNRAGMGGFPGPKMPRLESAPDHFAQGFTARDGAAFQGQHGPSVLIVFDEAEGVDPIFWEAAEPQLQGKRYAFLGIYNPTTQSGPTVEAERSGAFRVVTMSCLDHPNVKAELAGQPPPYPSAVRLGRLREMLAAWSDVIPADQAGPGDVILDPKDGLAYRPGPVAQSRLLGIRPTTAFNAVWSEWLVDCCIKRRLPARGPLQIGVDCAAFGDDDSAFHVRRGGNSLHHEAHNGLPPSQIALRAQQLAERFGEELGVYPKAIPIAIDMGGGYGLGPWELLARGGWNAVGVNGSSESPDPEEFPNLRSALWFGLAEEAARGNVSFAGLDARAQEALRRELTAPLYIIDVRGRRVVEPKQKTKERLKRSPDNADATLLAYCNVGNGQDRVAGQIKVAT